MATHSSILAWRIPWTIQSMGLDMTEGPALSPLWLRWYRICLQCRRLEFNPRVRKISWKREWRPVSVFLSGEFHGQRSLAGYSPWSCKKSGTTEQLTLTFNTGLDIQEAAKKQKACFHLPKSESLVPETVTCPIQEKGVLVCRTSLSQISGMTLGRSQKIF